MTIGVRDFECVWPIEDDKLTLRQLIREATPHIPYLAAQAHTEIAGLPTWRTARAEDVPGWQAHAPGLLLIAQLPVREMRRRPLTHAPQIGGRGY